MFRSEYGLKEHLPTFCYWDPGQQTMDIFRLLAELKNEHPIPNVGSYVSVVEGSLDEAKYHMDPQVRSQSGFLSVIDGILSLSNFSFN